MKFKKGAIVLSLKCHACKQMRTDAELGCQTYSPIDGVTTFFRYCKDKPECKQIAQTHARDKLLS